MSENNPNYRIINYCNEHYSVRELYEQVTGRVPGLGKIYCCFHHNSNTPAAKIYDNKLKCFGECNRVFGAYDFLKRFFPDELKKVKQSIILPQAQTRFNLLKKRLDRSQLDLTKPVGEVIKTIIQFYEQNQV